MNNDDDLSYFLCKFAKKIKNMIWYFRGFTPATSQLKSHFFFYLDLQGRKKKEKRTNEGKKRGKNCSIVYIEETIWISYDTLLSVLVNMSVNTWKCYSSNMAYLHQGRPHA